MHSVNKAAIILAIFALRISTLDGCPHPPTTTASHHKEQALELYKIITTEAWQQHQDKSMFPLSKQDQKFIHFSEKDDIVRICRKFFKDEKEVIVLKIDSTKLPGELRKEKNPGGSKAYYHLYGGGLPKASIISHEHYTTNKNPL